VFGPHSSRYLPENHVVLPGSEIFKIFCDGTTIKEPNKNDPSTTVEVNIKSEWSDWQESFNSILLDIADLQKDSK